ncbi:MAG: 5-dehydro-4-deoxy-D-glucuronate isomerase [Candidatus Marinimicrobia bacterium]|jgi:4-deoxy-L-threo-5-hexosulose-uronate ketol-isomerase|nr:5-dehydro-4-deoxy-D-glucuronate isomerase [Candidatus Neomarinimicrobiota bacterium]
MKTRYLPNNQAYQRMTTDELRANFLVEELFQSGKLSLLYADVDRAIVGSAVPLNEALILKGSMQEMATEVFCERREVGVINIGGTGQVKVDNNTYTLDRGDALYIGKGSEDIAFSSDSVEGPAEYYILSFPAHAVFPTKLIKFADAEVEELGQPESANVRRINKLIHPGALDTCQIVMGITSLASGNIWNTMPPHLHPRRMEIYLYFDVDDDQRVFHFMGEPNEIRTLVMKSKQAVISPSWSMHSAAGTSNYTFIWGMGGENQAFADMDFIDMETLR